MNEDQQTHYSKEQNQMNASLVKKILLGTVKPQPQGISPMQQLQLTFNKDNSKDINQLRMILSTKLTYPSSDIAQIHMQANRLGDLDIKPDQQSILNQDFKQISQNAKFCPCCGFIFQQNTLTICKQIKQINHMGISTFLYFQTIKNIILLLFTMLCVFSIYALASNYVFSNRYKQSFGTNQVSPQINTFDGFLAISLGSKMLNQSADDKISFMIQCWLGVANVILWGILFGIIKKRQKQMALLVDIDSKTASDYTLIIENFPSDLNKQQFQTMLKQYKTALGQTDTNGSKAQIKIKKINKAKPFYLNQDSFQDQRLILLNKKYEQYRQMFIDWIKYRVDNKQFNLAEAQRQKVYKQFQQIKKRRMNIYIQITNKIKKQKKQQQFEETVPTFVTFQSNYNKIFLQQLHQNSHKLFSCLPCFDKSKYLYFKSKQGQTGNLAKIKQAPQPEDIIWTNLGQPSHIANRKRLITYGVSILVLGASFGAIYGLSKVQFDYDKTHNDASNQYISILISLSISIINIIIQRISLVILEILRLLTKFQRNSTYTQYQTSLGLKAVLALLINSIIIPILVNYFFKQNLYGVNGLAYDVFLLSITNSFLSPLLKIFDLYYYFTRFWRKLKDQPLRKLYMNQNQLNTISEYMEFEIGYQYIYIVNLFLFTCFFCSLQPIIVVFAIAGLSLMYWAQKYSLFNRCKRPTPGNNSINTAMYQLIYLGPAFYTIGSFCWSDFFKQSFIGIAPNLTAAVISGVIFLIPYKSFIKKFFLNQPQPQSFYENDRIFVPSQYDRLNPSTSAQGIEDYMNYLASYKKKLQIQSYQNPFIGNLVGNIFQKQFGLGRRPQYQSIAPSFNNLFSINNGSYFDQNQLILQQLLGTNKNIFNPALIGNAILNQNHPLKMPTQNWFTQQQAEVVTFVPNNRHSNLEQSKNNKNDILNLMFRPDQGETVTYQPQTEVAKDGSINFIYQAVAGLSQKAKNGKLPPINKKKQNLKQKGQIPLNISLNMFGSLLKPTEQQPQLKQKQEIPSNLFLNLLSNNNNYNQKKINPVDMYSINLLTNIEANQNSKNHEETMAKLG